MQEQKTANNMKKMSVANFNIVFVKEDKEYPLLDYFDTILMPALRSGITRSQENNTYLIMDTEVKEDKNAEFILTGLLVKSTTLEVKSMFDEDGNLVKRNDVYPAAPFSTFIIYLKNHRMILVENQKRESIIRQFSLNSKICFRDICGKRKSYSSGKSKGIASYSSC